MKTRESGMPDEERDSKEATPLRPIDNPSFLTPERCLSDVAGLSAARILRLQTAPLGRGPFFA